MAFYILSPEELKGILDFVNNENNDVVSTDAPQRFMNIAAAFNAKMYKMMLHERNRAVRSERTVERMKTRLSKQSEAGDFVELKLDSIDLAKCIIYLLQEKEAYYTRNTVQYILFEAYATWLSEHSERLTSERPVAQEWGPHFWRVSNKLGKMSAKAGYDDWTRITSQNPGVAAFLRNVVGKYYDWKEADLKNMMKESVPYKNAARKGDDDKWGHPIKDADIFAWNK